MTNLGNLANSPKFLKWAGGKSSLLPLISPKIDTSKTHYIEPFVGGGSVFFHVKRNFSCFKKFTLVDINERLIKTYRVVKDQPEEMVSDLGFLFAFYWGSNESDRLPFYNDMREEFNSGNISDLRLAILFYFLNKTCFNGLYRENSKGNFNVPPGSYKRPGMYFGKIIRDTSELLQGVQILCDDSLEFLGSKHVDSTCFLYVDPPYVPLAQQKTNFSQYTKKPFGDFEQRDLALKLWGKSYEGTSFLLSNSSAPWICDTYKTFGFLIEEIECRRSISGNSKMRGEVKEILVSSNTSQS